MLALVAGLDRAAAAGVAARLVGPGTALVAYDLRDGIRRTLRVDGTAGAHLLSGHCASCALRADLAMLADAFDRLVVHLDPLLEPGPIARELPVTAVVSVLDDDWLAAATGDDLVDGDRTVAQVAVGHAEAADLLVLHGALDLRTRAVLDRLAAPVRRVHAMQVAPDLLDGVRHAPVDEVFGPLLRGQPPLSAEAGVQVVTFRARGPFDPRRLDDALDVLLHGVVRARGRLWMASRPDEVLLLESAGGGLALSPVDTWLAASDDWGAAAPHRRARAAMDWHPAWGDRVQELAVITHAADPDRITRAFTEAVEHERTAL
ncbi:GTP-binding protein [Actinokineospora bangkokensis]|uniref:GTP-binding protein n=1 Tax=Actinokineospora bangkokensis TaxID=1193682 RepID=UPI000B080F84|nr:GTP-binding protein [Actinokineospora bangkokensis]